MLPVHDPRRRRRRARRRRSRFALPIHQHARRDGTEQPSKDDREAVRRRSCLGRAHTTDGELIPVHAQRLWCGMEEADVAEQARERDEVVEPASAQFPRSLAR